jgi:hypothetical protein
MCERAIAAMPSIRLKTPTIPSSTAAKMTIPKPSPWRAPLLCLIVADVISTSQARIDGTL